MAQQSEDKLRAAWRALAGNSAGEGWRTIQIDLDGPCPLLAGRHFPGDEEAVLFGFSSVRMPPADQLPEGRGFRVDKVDWVNGGTHKWLSLSRQATGNLELFTMMVNDIIAILEAYHGINDEGLLHYFLGRIRAWQDFMQRSDGGLLSLEEEVGLFGELVVLESLLRAGIPATVAMETWQGPLGGLQDFMIGTGAVEVKTTVAINGFPATIGSLDQLDDSVRQPLFVAGVRLSIDGSGRTLPDIVADIRGIVQSELAAIDMFNNRLLHAVFLDAFSNHYTRRFVYSYTRILPVVEGFPRLTRTTVGIGIIKARYELDLDLVAVEDIALDLALEKLGGV